MPVAIDDGLHDRKEVQDYDELFTLDLMKAIFLEATEIESYCPLGLKAFLNTCQEFKSQENPLDKYEIIGALGRGAHGQILLAKSKSEKCPVTIKKISKADYHHQTSAMCLREELDIMKLAAVQQKHWICSLLESFQNNEYLYLVMPFMAGGSLADLPYRPDLHADTLESERDPEVRLLPLTYIKFYMSELLLAMNELHQLGYIHRDIKPDNVLLRENGHLILIDFGSAAKLDPITGRIKCKVAVGTADYISPEVLAAQNSREGSEYGIECDYWGFGICLYELITGELPFYSESLLHTYSKIQKYDQNLTLDHPRLDSEAKDLLGHLICHPKERYNFENVKAHPLFKEIDFNRLEPPFYPGHLSDYDDVIEEYIEPMKPIRTNKKIFEGYHLPFVGYTWRRNEKKIAKEVPQVGQTEPINLQKKCSDLEASAQLDRKKITELVRKMEELMINKGYGIITEVTSVSKYAKTIREQRQRILQLEQLLLREQQERLRLLAEVSSIRSQGSDSIEGVSLRENSEGSFHKSSCHDSIDLTLKGEKKSRPDSPRGSILKYLQKKLTASDLGNQTRQSGSWMKVLIPGEAWTKKSITVEGFLLSIWDYASVGTYQSSIKIDLRSPAFWVQPVKSAELAKLKAREASCCFKIRFSNSMELPANINQGEKKPKRVYDPRNSLDLKKSLEKEIKLREGAIQMMAACDSVEGQSLAKLQIDEATKRVAYLTERLNRLAMGQDRPVGPQLIDLSEATHTFRKLWIKSADCQICLRTFDNSSAFVECERCGVQCHRECSSLLLVSCEEVLYFEENSINTLPVYFWTATKEEARGWIRELEHIRRWHLLKKSQ